MTGNLDACGKRARWRWRLVVASAVPALPVALGAYGMVGATSWPYPSEG